MANEISVAIPAAQDIIGTVVIIAATALGAVIIAAILYVIYKRSQYDIAVEVFDLAKDKSGIVRDDRGTVKTKKGESNKFKLLGDKNAHVKMPEKDEYLIKKNHLFGVISMGFSRKIYLNQIAAHVYEPFGVEANPGFSSKNESILAWLSQGIKQEYEEAQRVNPLMQYLPVGMVLIAMVISLIILYLALERFDSITQGAELIARSVAQSGEQAANVAERLGELAGRQQG